jgi:wobble nucleotide-excising tRNase
LTKKQIEQSIAQEMETYFFKEFKRIQESMLMQLEKTVDRKLEQYTEKHISEQVALRFKKALAAANSLQDPQ